MASDLCSSSQTRAAHSHQWEHSGTTYTTRKQFIVTCKRCRREIPAGVQEFPFQSIVVACPLCGELRRYLPSEVCLGVLNALVSKSANKGHE